MRTTRMKELALLLSLLALGTLGLVACGGDDDDQTTAASETKTTRGELAADRTPVAPTPAKYGTKLVPKGTGRKAIRSGSASAYTPKVSKAHNRVDLFTPSAELVFCRGRESKCAASEPATAEAGDLTIVWENGGDLKHNICMEDEQGKPVFKKVVFNGGRHRSAASTPRCSKTIRARTIRARAKVKPGEYTYYCSVGRHREAGMEGTLTVK
jgi:plastocyanin